MMNRKMRSGGFTLPELLMVAGLLAVVSGAMFVTVLSGQSAFLSLDSSIQLQEEARKAFNSMTRELREAGGAIAVSSSPSQQLDFQLALGYNLTSVAGCPADAVCWGAWDADGNPQYNWTVRYALKTTGSNTQLVRRLFNANPVSGSATPVSERILANQVDNATSPVVYTSFAWDQTNSVITINLQTKIDQSALLPGGIRSSGRLTTQIKLRNS